MISLKNKSMASYTPELLAILLYVIIALIMIYTFIGFDIKGKYIGHKEVVVWANYFWWFDYSITHLFTNPLHNTYLFYPLGLDMIDNIFPLLLFIPITHSFGSVVSYNIYVLLTFILAAYGMYLMVDYLLEDKYVAFVSGLIFAFCPFHFGASMGHLHTLSILWIPFFVMYFLKMYNEPIRKNIIICSVLFAVNALTSWTIAIMLSIFISIFLIINFRPLVTKRYIFMIISFVIVSAILISPGLYIMMINYLTNPYMVMSLNDFIYYSADILGFIVPSPIHPFFGDLTKNIYF